MVKKMVTIKNVTGLTLKPAEQLSRVALRFKSHTGFEYNGGSANAKSILSILASGARQGDEIILVCSGRDENEALDALVKAIDDGLGE